VSALLLLAIMELPTTFLERLQALNVSSTPRVLIVSVADQKLALFVDGAVKETWSISTARKGVGQKLDSHQTPLGLHRVKQKIGKSAPWGAIFDSRESTGKKWSPNRGVRLVPSKQGDVGEGGSQEPSTFAKAAADKESEIHPFDKLRTSNPKSEPDFVTSRIFWLEGLEPGLNCGMDAEGRVVDSYKRYIYIHGTNHEEEIGKPASLGCIRMANSDVITLFDVVQECDLVWIQE